MGLAVYFLAYVSGLIVAPFLVGDSFFAVLPFLCALLWFLVRRQGRAYSLFPLLGFFFTLALSLYHIQLAPPAGSLAEFAGSSEVLTLDGSVTGLGPRAAGKSYLDISVQTIGSAGTVAATSGRARIYLDDALPRAGVGDRVRLRSRLREPRAFGTPGEFDFGRYLARRQIFVTGFVRDADAVAVFAQEPEPGIAARVHRQRWKVAELIDRSVAPNMRGLAQALVIGEKGWISEEQRRVLARSGLSHLFSISGLHLGLVAFFAYLVLRAFWTRSERLLLAGPPQRYLPLLLLPVLFGYLLFTGDALPTRRAFMMAAAGALLPWFALRVRPINLLLSLAFAVLLFDPLALYEPSFQLSYLGVLGIILFAGPLASRIAGFSGPVRWLSMLAAVTFAATVATAPLVLANFHQLSPAGLVANLIAAPVIGFLAVPLGLAGVISSFAHAGFAGLWFGSCAWLLEAMYNCAKWLTGLPILGGWTFFPTIGQTAGVAVLAALILTLDSRSLSVRLRGGLLVAAVGLLTWPGWASSEPTFTVLSVGQGDSMVVSLDGNRHFLVDGGGLYSESFDVGERLIAPALGRLGIQRLEAVILTHDHPDHRKGLLYILDNFPVERFLSPHASGDLDAGLREILQRRGVPQQVPAAGWSSVSPAHNRLQVFRSAQTHVKTNDQSLVLYLDHAAGGALLTGDLERTGVRGLLSAELPGPVALLKLPHHGSAGSDPAILCDSLAIRQAFVSVGRDNIYNLPSASVRREMAQRRIPLWRTDHHGTVRFAASREGWKPAHWVRGRFQESSGLLFAR